MAWKVDMLRVSWHASENLSNLLLYDAENGTFDKPERSFWEQILPDTNAVQCSPFGLEQTLIPLADSKVKTFFETLYSQIHSKINIKDYYDFIANKTPRKNRKYLNEKVKLNNLKWIDVLEDNCHFNGNLKRRHNTWRFPFK